MTVPAYHPALCSLWNWAVVLLNLGSLEGSYPVRSLTSEWTIQVASTVIVKDRRSGC